jgi:hypothetical protein
LGSMDGFSCLLIAFSFFQNDCLWHSSSDFAVDTSSFEAITARAVAWYRFASSSSRIPGNEQPGSLRA